jgi:hypothetical protein
MGDQVYEKIFTVVPCAPHAVPAEQHHEQSLGRHLDGYRIGFDLGASDLKVSAVVDGEAIFSQEIEWEPRQQTDPQYHKDRIVAALAMAALKMPRMDAIGGRLASPFRGLRIQFIWVALFAAKAPSPCGATAWRCTADEQCDRVDSRIKVTGTDSLTHE